MQITELFTTKGFFPKEVPPIFSSKAFGSAVPTLRAANLGAKKEWTHCDPFNMPHAKIGRRLGAIANPAAFFHLVEVIATNWVEIEKCFDRSPISFSRPVMPGSRRSIAESDFQGYRDALLSRAAGYTHVLHADFQDFSRRSIPMQSSGRSTARMSARPISVPPQSRGCGAVIWMRLFGLCRTDKRLVCR